MLRFGQLSVTLSNACEVRIVCRRNRTVSMAILLDYCLRGLPSANIGHTLNLKTSNEAPIGPLLPLMKWVVSIWSLKE